MESLSAWLRELGLERYASIFAENDVDFETLTLLTDAELERLGVSLGHRKKLLKALAELNPKEPSAALVQGTPQQPSPLPSAAVGGERRQLTVLFCDLVGFTELANRLDPELLQAVIRSYEDACAVCITRYEGYVFQRLGDGIVAFFGYPLAHEGEAERAIRAGLEVLESLSKLDVLNAGRLQVRIGIATGLVVVSSAENSAAGETMNLASRLQAIAQPDSIVVSERVHRLAGGVFDYQALGEHSLKGVGKPTQAWRVVSLSAAVSRFEAATGGALTPLVGREQEIALLIEYWQLAQEGEGQVVLLSGEPGIGKSRILSALRERLGKGGATLTFQCSPYHVNSAFYPSIDHLERALKFTREEPAASRLDKLEALLVSRYGRPVSDVRFIAALLSIPCEERYRPLAMAPQRQKDDTIRALVDLLEAIAQRQSALMLFEDVHWADPTTLEVLDLLVDRIRGFPMLLLITHRPQFQPNWGAHGHVTALALSRLTRTQSAAMVSRLARGKRLPPELLGQIIAKTDGVPLFVEELTRAVLESGTLKEAGDHYVYAGAAAAVSIPSTLRDSLMARLDRVPQVKEIAQIGAVIGREFSYELISVVAPMRQAQLDEALERLTDSGLAFRRGTIPDATYTFKHALVQDAAYDSILKSRRQALHADIARVLEQRFPETKDSEPELLAHHLTAAGLAEPAIDYWRKAGELARGRVALAEAISHLSKGLELIGTQPPSVERDAEELALHTPLGTAWMALRGWAAPEAEASFSAALRLAKSLDHRPSYLPVLVGLHLYDLNQGRVAESLKWVRETQDAAEALDDAELRIMGHVLALTSHYYLGNLQEAHLHGERIAALYNPDQGRHIEHLTNHDPLTRRGVYDAFCLWLLGYPDQALRLHEATQVHARARGHPFGLCHVLIVGSWVFAACGELDQALMFLEEGERLGRAHSMPLFSDVIAPLWRAVAWMQAGRASECIPQINDGLGRWNALGGHLVVPTFKAALAEGIARNGDMEEGLRLIAECLAQIERPGYKEGVWLAEVLRLKGWMLEQQGKLGEAERNLHAAIDVARQQSARSWELRTATTLARLMMARGDRAEARALLVPIHGWFSEGFNTQDLKAAHQLLDELG